MVATITGDRDGFMIDGDMIFTGPTIALVIPTWALAERLYVRGALTLEEVLRYPCPL